MTIAKRAAAVPLDEQDAHHVTRYMLPHELEQVAAIDGMAFCDRSWDAGELRRFLKINHKATMYVAVIDGRVAGYMVYAMERDHMRLLRLAVHPEESCKGVGVSLVARLARGLSADDRTYVSVRLRESSLYVLNWFARRGFLATGIDREFYRGPDDTGEDAIVMRLDHVEPDHAKSRRALDAAVAAAAIGVAGMTGQCGRGKPWAKLPRIFDGRKGR